MLLAKRSVRPLVWRSLFTMESSGKAWTTVVAKSTGERTRDRMAVALG